MYGIKINVYRVDLHVLIPNRGRGETISNRVIFNFNNEAMIFIIL